MEQQNKQKKRHFSAQEKLKILWLHLLEKKLISELCDEHNLHPTQFYKWQKTFFENGTEALNKQSRFLNCHTRKIRELESKLKRKDEVIAEIAEALIKSKKVTIQVPLKGLGFVD